METIVRSPADRRTRRTLAALAAVEFVAILLLLWFLRHPAGATAPCAAAGAANPGAMSAGGGTSSGGDRAGTQDGAGTGGAGSMNGAATAGGGGGGAGESGASSGAGSADDGGTPAPLAAATAGPSTAGESGSRTGERGTAGAGSGTDPQTADRSDVKTRRDFGLDASGVPHYPGAVAGSIASATSDGSNAGIDAGSGAVFTTNDSIDTVAAWYKAHLPADWDVDRAPVPGADIVMFSPHGANPNDVGIVLLHAPGKSTAIVDRAGR